MCLAAIGLVHSVRREQGILLAQVDIQGREMTVGVDLTQALTPEEAAEALALRAEISTFDPGRVERPA